ncbi:MAG: dihydropteroate synthase [Flaviflexus sp.]|nr:dihydropteroate synthase [Flaviflexus sp.]
MEIMGVLNCTPDSFSDGGRWASREEAVARGRLMVRQGATIVDIGGESTRPGAEPVDPEVEWERIGEVLTTLAGDRVRCSVDTYHAATAARAIEAGADIINDVTGGRVDPEILEVVASSHATYILQHSRGGAASADSAARYEDIIDDIVRELDESIERATGAGIDPTRIILDPGLGFSKVGDQDWEVLRRFDELTRRLDFRWLIGASRKRFLTKVGQTEGEKDLATAAITALLVGRAWGVRVHDAASSALAAKVARGMGRG